MVSINTATGTYQESPTCQCGLRALDSGCVILDILQIQSDRYPGDLARVRRALDQEMGVRYPLPICVNVGFPGRSVIWPLGVEFEAHA
jgi:hypothetical protein